MEVKCLLLFADIMSIIPITIANPSPAYPLHTFNFILADSAEKGNQIDMTEYELADLVISAQGTLTPVVSLMVTVLTGYLIVAWLAGDKLTRAQVILVSTLFVFIEAIVMYSWVARWTIVSVYYSELVALNAFKYQAPTIWAAPIFVGLFTLAMLASLKFMWDVRHPKTK